MKKDNTLLTVAAVAAGVLLLSSRKDKQSGANGIGKLDRRKLWEEVNDYLNSNIKRCNRTVSAYFPGIDKNNSIQEYLEVGKEYDTGEVYWDSHSRRYIKGREYMQTFDKAVCKYCVNFTQNEYRIYEGFCNMLLYDFDALKGKGGTHFTGEDNPWWYENCILISFNGIPQFVVDPEGHSYARCIGFLSSFNTWLV